MATKECPTLFEQACLACVQTPSQIYLRGGRGRGDKLVRRTPGCCVDIIRKTILDRAMPRSITKEEPGDDVV